MHYRIHAFHNVRLCRSVLCAQEIITGSVDGGLRSYDVRQGQLVTDRVFFLPWHCHVFVALNVICTEMRRTLLGHQRNFQTDIRSCGRTSCNSLLAASLCRMTANAFWSPPWTSGSSDGLDGYLLIFVGHERRLQARSGT